MYFFRFYMLFNILIDKEYLYRQNLWSTNNVVEWNLQFQPQLKFLQNLVLKTKLKRTRSGPQFHFCISSIKFPKDIKCNYFSGIMLHFVDSDSSESEESLAQV